VIVAMERPVVYLSDRRWEDDSIEREIIESAGWSYRAAPCRPSQDRLPSPETIADVLRASNVVGLLTCLAPITAEVLDASDNLRVVTRVGSGVDNIDVEAARQRGVIVTNVPDYCIEEVSDHAVAMVLNWARGIMPAANAVRAGEPEPSGVKRRRVASLTCGVVGYGLIGRAIARKLRGLGAQVVATRRNLSVDATESDLIRLVPLPDLLSTSDVVVLATPLNPQTHHLIGADQIARMPKGGLLVNVGRGPVVDNHAMADALTAGHLGGVALDVWEGEPHLPGGIAEHPAAVLTPHIAYSSESSATEVRTLAARRLVETLRNAEHPAPR
jgi:D-3-phosphoglycerate dehydrogenase